MSRKDGVNRREFVTSTVGVSSAAAMASSASAARPAAKRVIGANDRINVGFIGVGGRGSSLMRLVLRMAEQREDINVTAVCDVYQKRKRLAQERSGAEFATLDYREVLARPGRGWQSLLQPLTTGMGRSRSTLSIKAKTCISRSRCATPSRKRGELPRK